MTRREGLAFRVGTFGGLTLVIVGLMLVIVASSLVTAGTLMILLGGACLVGSWLVIGARLICRRGAPVGHVEPPEAAAIAGTSIYAPVTLRERWLAWLGSCLCFGLIGFALLGGPRSDWLLWVLLLGGFAIGWATITTVVVRRLRRGRRVADAARRQLEEPPCSER